MQKKLWSLGLLFLAVMLITPLSLHGQVPMSLYVDSDYHYGFRYPAAWQLIEKPEGEANRLARVLLRGPKESLFTVNILPMGKATSQLEFQSQPDTSATIKSLGQQTIAGIYQPISQNLRATQLKTAEAVDLSNDEAIQYSISTLNQMAKGDPVVAAGIHVLPFGKDYRIDFTMITRLDRAAEHDNQLMTAVFNSFKLLREPSKR